jgi:hypothetical protein
VKGVPPRINDIPVPVQLNEGNLSILTLTLDWTDSAWIADLRRTWNIEVGGHRNAGLAWVTFCQWPIALDLLGFDP